MHEFCFEATKFLFFKNAAFLDGYCYYMDAPLTSDGDGNALAGASDLCRIFSPKLHQRGMQLQSIHGSAPLIRSADGILRADLRETLERLLCLKLTQYADIWAASWTQWQPDYEVLLSCRAMCRKKAFGELRLLRWEEEISKLLPYVLYLPTQMHNKKCPLLIVFHGAGGTTEDAFYFSNHRISELAEKKNFLILAVSACYADSSYGCPAAPYGIDSMDAELFELSPEKADRLKRTERTVVKTIKEILHTYPVDLHRIYLAGNSMGAMATFYYAAKYSDKICAIAPAGAVPDPNAFPTEKLRKMPVFFTAGTEDFHGYDYLQRGCEQLKRAGVPLIFYTVGGGDHATSWVRSIDLWMEFLDSAASDMPDQAELAPV